MKLGKLTTFLVEVSCVIFLSFSIALDFRHDKFSNARCDHRLGDSSQKEMKLNIRYSRALDSGWLPTNSFDANAPFRCKSDLGSIGLHKSTDFLIGPYMSTLLHGMSYSYVVKPYIVKSDESIKIIPPKM